MARDLNSSAVRRTQQTPFVSLPSKNVLTLLSIQCCSEHWKNKTMVNKTKSVTCLAMDCVPPDGPEPDHVFIPSTQSRFSHLLSGYRNRMNSSWLSKTRAQLA